MSPGNKIWPIPQALLMCVQKADLPFWQKPGRRKHCLGFSSAVIQLQLIQAMLLPRAKWLRSAEQRHNGDLGSSVCLLVFWKDIYVATFLFFPPEVLRIQQNKYLYHMQNQICEINTICSTSSINFLVSLSTQQIRWTRYICIYPHIFSQNTLFFLKIKNLKLQKL